jgi:murein DD-endopeptidase MepM/ murein hydrolase activator NlpD
MAQEQFKGYARSIGFDPIKAPYAAIEQMAAHDNRIISNMQRHRAESRKVRDDYQQSLEQKFDAESRDRDKHHARRQELRAFKQQSLQNRGQQEYRNGMQRAKNLEETFGALSNFSAKLGETVTAIKTYKDEQDTMDEYLTAMSEGLPYQRQQQYDQASELLAMAGEKQDQVADKIAGAGAPPEVVMQLRAGNKAREIGRIKAYAEMAAVDFGPWLSQQLAEMGATSAGDVASASRLLMEQYLKMNGLFGLKSEFLAPTLLKMRGNLNAELHAARKSDLKARSEEMQDTALNNLSAFKNGESLNQAFLDLSRSYDADGSPLGARGAKDRIFKELEDTTRYSDDEVLALLGTMTLDQNKTWGDRFPRDVDDLLRKRREDRSRERGLDEGDRQAARKEAERQLINWLQNDWNGSDETLDSMIAQARMEGIPVDQLEAYRYNSQGSKNSRFWEGEFERMWENGTLTAEDVNQPGVPYKLRQEYLQRVKEFDSQRAEAGMSKDDLKKTFESALRPLIKATSMDSTAHFSLGLATQYAIAQYNRNFKRYAKTMEPGAASTQAMNDLLNQIQKGTGAFTVVEGQDTGDGSAFFAQFTPGSHAGAPKASVNLNPQVAVTKFAKNPNIIEKDVFVDKALLKDIDERIAKGRPISVPDIYYDLARIKPDMNAVDILNAQLKAAGFTSQVQTGASQSLNQINDPKLQQILKMPTQANINTAIIGGGHAPATVRKGTDGFQDIMAITQLSGYKFPMLAAAQWALESAYGQAQSGRHNYFGIKGGGRSVSTQEFINGQMVTVNASFRDYNSPLESAKDYVALMNNSRYAPGLAAARTPREAAQAVHAAGYATDPAYVSKLVKIMQSQGINVDAPYTYQGPPTRNPAYMSPTVAYKIYGIGPTSTGPHLDVKQVGGGRFAENALDNFVSVQLNGRRVPLSAVPVTDGFDDHVARGSHGIDYAAPNGTPVLLQNGARIVSRASTVHGDKLVIQLPDGRRFSFLHGKAV